jgi:hypothetical protein
VDDPRETVRSLAELVTFGDGKGNPQLKVRAAPARRPRRGQAGDLRPPVGDLLAPLRPADRRCTSAADKRPAQQAAYAPEELRQVVFGAYAALSRLPGGTTEMRIRQTAISRLLASVPVPKDSKPKKGRS